MSVETPCVDLKYRRTVRAMDLACWTRTEYGEIYVTCGRCGARASLTDHSVDTKGRIMPSLVCPMNDCGWHVFGQLTGNVYDDPR